MWTVHPCLPRLLRAAGEARIRTDSSGDGHLRNARFFNRFWSGPINMSKMAAWTEAQMSLSGVRQTWGLRVARGSKNEALGFSIR